MRLFATLLIAMSLSTGLNSCTTNPATGRSQLNFMGDAEEIQLGAQAAPQFLAEGGGEINSPQILAYVRAIGDQLAAASERPTLPWEFHVLDSKVINAFALPGGKVFISRGLLEKMSNEAQLAGVLGHEVGHVTAQHIGQQMTRAMIAQGLIGALGAAGDATDNDWLRVLGAGGQVGGGLYLLSFGRDQESEADALGLRYMTRLGYSPQGMVGVMEILKAAGGGGQWEILSTHPDPARRLTDVQAIIRRDFPDASNAAKYRINQERFQTVVIGNLRKMPAAKHGFAPPAEPATTVTADAGGAPATSAKPQAARPLTALEKAMLLAKCQCHPNGGHQGPLAAQADDLR